MPPFVKLLLGLFALALLGVSSIHFGVTGPSAAELAAWRDKDGRGRPAAIKDIGRTYTPDGTGERP